MHSDDHDRPAILKPLKNENVLETKTILLSVSISKPQQAYWYKDDCQIVEDGRAKIQVNSGGLHHTLAITNASLEDSGDYSFNIDDGVGGMVSSQCTITVKGKINYNCNDLFNLNNSTQIMQYLCIFSA